MTSTLIPTGGPLSAEPATRPDVDRFMTLDWNLALSPRRIADIHPYPARFIPELPAAALDVLNPRGPVLDPFCGSGTTLVEAIRRGLPAVGVDINPIACLMSRVKTTSWRRERDPDLLELHRAGLVEHATRGSDDSGRLGQIPRIDHWFDPWASGSSPVRSPTSTRFRLPTLGATASPSLSPHRPFGSVDRNPHAVRSDRQVDRLRRRGACVERCSSSGRFLVRGTPGDHRRGHRSGHRGERGERSTESVQERLPRASSHPRTQHVRVLAIPQVPHVLARPRPDRGAHERDRGTPLLLGERDGNKGRLQGRNEGGLRWSPPSPGSRWSRDHRRG